MRENFSVYVHIGLEGLKVTKSAELVRKNFSGRFLRGITDSREPPNCKMEQNDFLSNFASK